MHKGIEGQDDWQPQDGIANQAPTQARFHVLGPLSKYYELDTLGVLQMYRHTGEWEFPYDKIAGIEYELRRLWQNGLGIEEAAIAVVAHNEAHQGVLQLEAQIHQLKQQVGSQLPPAILAARQSDRATLIKLESQMPAILAKVGETDKALRQYNLNFGAFEPGPVRISDGPYHAGGGVMRKKETRFADGSPATGLHHRMADAAVRGDDPDEALNWWYRLKHALR